RAVIAVAGLACFAIVGQVMGPQLTSPFTTSTPLLGYLVVVLGCLAILIAFMGVRMQAGWLTYLGKISYGLYVFHVACLFIVHNVPVLDRPVLREVVTLTLTVLVAALSYALIEKPFLNLKKQFTHVQSRPV